MRMNGAYTVGNLNYCLQQEARESVGRLTTYLC